MAIDLRYEDLVADPDATMTQVFEFLDIDTDVKVSDGFKTQVEHHVIGNKMSKSSDEEIVLDDAWRRRPGLAGAFERAGGVPANHANGYVDP